MFSAKGGELPLGPLPPDGLRSVGGFENFGVNVTSAKTAFDLIGTIWASIPAGRRRRDLHPAAVFRKRRLGPAGDSRIGADGVTIGRTPYFGRTRIFFAIALRELTIGPVGVRGRSE